MSDAHIIRSLISNAHRSIPIFDSGRLGGFYWFSLYPLSLLLLLLSIIIYIIAATNTRRNTSYWIKYRSGKWRRRQIIDRKCDYDRRQRSIFDWTHSLIYYVKYYEYEYCFSRGIIGRIRRRRRRRGGGGGGDWNLLASPRNNTGNGQ